MSHHFEIKDGYMYGPWRNAYNDARDMEGSIHEDTMAQKAGMRGGAVVGITHLNLFPPLLLEAFGQRWFEHGCLSIFYTYALVHGEQLRAVIGVPPEGANDVQVEAWLETPDGKTVGKGTTSMGNLKEPSYIRGLELESARPEDMRIMADAMVGDPLPSREVTVTQETMDNTLRVIRGYGDEPLDWYTGDSPWGGAIIPPSAVYGAMTEGPDHKYTASGDEVSFFGATEIRFMNGPVKANVPYKNGGEIICLGASPKTEFFWFDAYLDDKDSGNRVAEMRHLTRFMKSVSSAWKESEK